MKQVIALGCLAVINLAIIVLLQYYIVARFGVGGNTDALFAGMTIPQLVLTIINSSLMHVLVPLLSGEKEKQIYYDSWAFLYLSGAFFAFIGIALGVTAGFWIPLIVPGFTPELQTQTIYLTRIQLVGIFFAAITGVQWAVYHARKRFIKAEFCALTASVLAFLSLFILIPVAGIVGAAWALTLRTILLALFLLPVMGKPVWPDLRNKQVMAAWSRLRPLIVGTIYFKTDPLVDRYLLSSATVGSLSLFYLAQQIYGAVAQIFNKAVTTPYVPALSEIYKNGEYKDVNKLFFRYLTISLLTGLAAYMVFALFGEYLLRIIFPPDHTKFSNIEELYWLLVFLGGVLVGSIVGQIEASSFYSCGDTKTPTRMSIITYTIFIPLKVFAFHYWQIKGLALCITLYYITNCLIMFLLFYYNNYAERNRSSA